MTVTMIGRQMASSTVAAPRRFRVAQQRSLLLAANITIPFSKKNRRRYQVVAKLKWNVYITPHET
jgi:hypothetical protein